MCNDSAERKSAFQRSLSQESIYCRSPSFYTKLYKEKDQVFKVQNSLPQYVIYKNNPSFFYFHVIANWVSTQNLVLQAKLNVFSLVLVFKKKFLDTFLTLRCQVLKSVLHTWRLSAKNAILNPKYVGGGSFDLISIWLMLQNLI